MKNGFTVTIVLNENICNISKLLGHVNVSNPVTGNSMAQENIHVRR